MAKAIALTRTHPAALAAQDAVRFMLVAGCGLALILAGPVLPF